MKLSLPTKYESADFHLSLTSDVQDGETPSSAWQRIKQEVSSYANQLHNQIRESETGLLNELRQSESQSPDKGNDESKGSIRATQVRTSPPGDEQSAPQNGRILRQKIKAAFGVLEAQKKVSKKDFVTNYLNGKKVDELTDDETSSVLMNIASGFPELGLSA